MAEEIVKTKKSTIQNFNLSNSADTINLATDLAKFIKENKLYQNIQGKEFVNVEGWQYAGSRLGIVPIAEEPQNISIEGELRYKCTVKLLSLSTNQIVGCGFAVCSNKEQGKKYYQEFAIASMAQTRAIGKAYRNMLAWIIRAAGYEPTPSEEIEPLNNEAGSSAEAMPATAPNAEPEIKESAVTNADAPKPSVKYASAKQKEEIIRLLNNPVITRQEKTKMLLNINKLDEERATQAIAKLNKVISDREAENEGQEAPAAPAETFRK